MLKQPTEYSIYLIHQDLQATDLSVVSLCESERENDKWEIKRKPEGKKKGQAEKQTAAQLSRRSLWEK